ncbi:MAG: diadenylate cyclase CdaA [Myxococcota bacterium]
MIEFLYQLWIEMVGYITTNFDPWRDTLDILLVALGVYWLLLLIRGTRAFQILGGVVVLISASLASEIFQLVTLRRILEALTGPAVIIIVVLFQHDIRRALARVGRGFFQSVAGQEETQMLEEIIRAAQALVQRRVGALIVLERETHLDDQIEAGTKLDAAVSKDLLISLFIPYSPLHDGAVVIQNGRLAQAGCILPLTLNDNLPEGVGTRHRAAVGITEETDAVVIVVSEETASISVVVGGEMTGDLDGPKLRVALRDVLSGGGDQSESSEMAETTESESGGESADSEPGERAESLPLRGGDAVGPASADASQQRFGSAS